MKGLGLLLVGLAACTGQDAPAPIEQGVSFTTYTDTLIVGTYDDNVTHVDLESRETSNRVVVTTVTVDQLVYRLTVDYTTGEIDLASPAVPANREQIAALHALEGELAFMAADDQTEVEATLKSAGTLLSDSLSGEVLPSVHTAMNRSYVNIGPSNTCRTLFGGSCSPYKQTGRDSDNCKGRCGAGCGSAHSGGNNHWTMDCAEHDYGIGPFGDCVDDELSAANYYTSGGSCFWAGNCNAADGCSSAAGGHGSSCRM